MLPLATPPRSASTCFPSPDHAARVTCFSISAEADPSVLPRVLDLVALFDLIPERCHVSRAEQQAGRPLLIDLQIADLTDDDMHRIQKKLEGMLLTTQILCSERRLARKSSGRRPE